MFRKTTVRRWISDSKIPYYRLNHQYRFSRSEIENWVLSCKQGGEFSPLERRRSRKRLGTQQFGLYRAIHKGGVYSDIQGDTKEEVICAAMQQIAADLHLDAEVITELLLDRDDGGDSRSQDALHRASLPDFGPHARKGSGNAVGRAHPETGTPRKRGALVRASIEKMLDRRLLVLCVLFTPSAFAQWLNYSVPGTPRTRDGKPNLTAPAPRALNGKPDLSGVWHVPPTGMKEMKRLFGEHADATDVPGMELDTISKYAINIFQDLKPEEWPVRPEAVEIQRRRTGARLPIDALFAARHSALGFAFQPTKIVQSPRLIAILYEADDKHRQIYTDGRTLPQRIRPASVARVFGGALGP